MRQLLVIFFALMIGGCSHDTDVKTEFSNITAGEKIPAFTVLKVEQAQQVYKGVAGRKFIYFLMSSCSGCHRQTPVVVDLWQSIRTEDPELDFLCIARGGGSSTFDAAKTYWQGVSDTPQNMPPLFYDTDRVVFDLFATSNVPRFYVTDTDGVVVWQGEGVIADKEELRRYINMSR